MHPLLIICSLALICSHAQLYAAGKIDLLTVPMAEADLKSWTTADHATMRIENGLLRVEVPKYVAGDPEAWARATLDVSARDLSDCNGIRFDIENPSKIRQALQLGLRDGAGGGATYSVLMLPGERRTLTLDFKKSPLSSSVNISTLVLVDLMTAFAADDTTWLVHGIETYTDEPETTQAGVVRGFLDDISRLTPEMRNLPAWEGKLKDRTEAVVIEARDALKNHGDLQKPDAELRSVVAEIRTVKLSADLKTPLVVWTVPLGTAFRPGEAMNDYTQPIGTLSVHTAGGQYEETILRVTNLTAATQDLQISVTGDHADAVSIRRTQALRARDKSIIGDALFPLGAGATVTVPAYETTELWVRVDTRHHDVPAGRHALTLQLADLREGGTDPITVPIEATVRAFDLDATPQQFKVETWAPLYLPRSFIIHGQERQAIDNMLDYGVNILHMYPGEIPWPKLNAQGELDGPIDYARHDEVMKLMRAHGNPMILYFMNMDDSANENWALQSDLEPLSEPWNKAVRAWIKDWAAHNKSLGLTTSEYALYLTDEPGEIELERYLAFGRLVREVDPAIQIYINASNPFESAEKSDELMKITDIWQPDETHGFDTDPLLRPLLEKYPQKQVWVYACRTGIRARQTNAHDYYRLMAWRAMRDGLTGIGYWSYCAAASEEENPWDGTGVSGSGAMLVYPGKDAPLASVRWELVRQAIDDTRYMQQLRAIVEKTTSDDARAAIRPLCNERLKEIADHPRDPSLVAQWRIDAGAAIEQWGTAAGK